MQLTYTPRLLSAAMDPSVPSVVRQAILSVTHQLDTAGAQLGGVEKQRPYHDPESRELREALDHLNVAVYVLELWLSRHPARG